jgi:anti-anti-sigma regulatory factor
MTTAVTSSTEATTETGLLRLPEALVLQHVQAVRDEILFRSTAGALAIDPSAVSTCDLAGLQLLLSTRALASVRRQNLTIGAPTPAIVAACTTFGIDIHHITGKP